MDTEQLKMILGTLQTMGEAGHSAFVWWLVLDKALPVAAWLLTFCGICLLVRMLIHRIGSTGLGERVRDTLGVGHPGPLMPNEEREVMARVRELMDKQA